MTYSWRARLGGVWALMHPGPSLITVFAYALCAVLAAQGRPSLGRLCVTALGLVCMQFAISALNDYRDQVADARNPAKRKPLVVGLVSPGFALGATVLLAAAMFALFIPFGWVSVLLAGTFLALGFAYDLGVKSTPFSGVMHGLAFPTLPLLAWENFARLTPALFTVLPLGMVLGIGIHLADALPDAAADTAAGTRGLAQALGRAALPVCWGSFALAIVLITTLASIHQPRPFGIWLSAAVLAIGLLLAAIASFRQASIPEAVRLKRNFALLVGCALVVVVGWFAVITG